MASQREIERKRIWPTWLIALLAVIQLLITCFIVGLETTSIVFDLWHSMSYAGFYCSIFFLITWISMFTVTCCNRGSLGCQIHVLVESILSIIAAAVLLYFNNLFLNDPYTCLFGSSYECSRDYYSSSYYSYYSNATSNSYTSGIYSTTGYTVKLACIKAELGCAAVMLTTCVVYILVFIVVTIRVRNADYNDFGNQPRVFPVPNVAPFVATIPRPPMPTTTFGPILIQPGQNEFCCQNCRARHLLQNTVPVAPNPTPIQPAVIPPQNLPFKGPIPPPVPPVTIRPQNAFGASQFENSWRAKFPPKVSLILGIIQLVLTVLIVILEIASLAIVIGYRPTGVGIWTAIPFVIAAVMQILLDHQWERSRLWATRALIAEIVLLVFTLILIGITGDYVQNGGYAYSWYSYTASSSSSATTNATSTFTTKFQITQAQLAFGILLMFSGWTYVGIYIYVTVVALWKPFNTLDLPHLFRE